MLLALLLSTRHKQQPRGYHGRSPEQPVVGDCSPMTDRSTTSSVRPWEPTQRLLTSLRPPGPIWLTVASSDGRAGEETHAGNCRPPLIFSTSSARLPGSGWRATS